MLELRKIRARRGEFRLELELELPRGEIGVVLGRSGSGKSTLLRLIAGLERAEEGSISLAGRLIDSLPPEERKVGLVFQDYALFPHLSVRRNIEFGPRMAGKSRAERRAIAERLAADLGIGSLLDRPTAALSGGEAQRVALGRSLAAEPELLLLDEPFSALDPGLRRELRLLLRAELAAQAMTALHVTHDVEEALSLADHIFLMDKGRIVERGSPEELYERPRTELAARFLRGGFLLPVSRIEKSGAGQAVARTAYGLFSLAEGGQGPHDRTGLLFLPRSAFSSGREAPGEEAAIDRFEARILTSEYAGASRRVLVEGKGAAGAGHRLELELPTRLAAEAGPLLRLRLEPRSARLLEPGPEPGPQPS